MKEYDFILMLEEIIEKIRNNYQSYHFFVERDFVWTVQELFAENIEKNRLSYVIYNDYPIEKGERRSRSVDLAVVRKGISYTDIITGKEKAELVIEFKFEPSKRREDILTCKFPVTDWKGIRDDIKRIKQFVGDGKAKTAVAMLIDEGGRYGHREIENPSKWVDWGNCGTDNLNVSIMWTALRFG